MRITPQSVCYLGQPCGTDNGPCDISSSTLAPLPPVYDRTTIGVGEQVGLTTSGTGWAMTGSGSLSTRAGSTTVFTAGSTAGTATVIAIGRRNTCTASSIIFTIITPTVVYYNTYAAVEHTQGFADIGIQSYLYLMPNNVSFAATWYQESQAYYQASGIYLCWDGKQHEPAPVPVPATISVGNNGTQLNATDSSYSSWCDGTQFAAGSETLNIPGQYSMSNGGPWYTINTVAVASSANAGALSRTKDHASGNTTVNSPTSGY